MRTALPAVSEDGKRDAALLPDLGGEKRKPRARHQQDPRGFLDEKASSSPGYGNSWRGKPLAHKPTENLDDEGSLVYSLLRRGWPCGIAVGPAVTLSLPVILPYAAISADLRKRWPTGS